MKALLIVIVRHLHRPGELLAVLDAPTPEMLVVRALLSEEGRYPSRRTWERRLAHLPETLPAQIGCLGRYLVDLLQPWATCGRAVAIDSTTLLACGGVWHRRHRALTLVPHSSIDREAGRVLVTSHHGRYPHTDEGASVRRVFHKLRSANLETFNDLYKAILDGHGSVPTRADSATRSASLWVPSSSTSSPS